MKTLQKRMQILYRFRCERCRTEYEMTEAEKIENDWQFTNYMFSKEHNKWICGPVDRDKDHRHNLLDRFYCPVCKCVRYVRKEDMHKFSVMDDGTEIQDY